MCSMSMTRREAGRKLRPPWLDGSTQAWAGAGVPGQEGGGPAAGQIQWEEAWGAVCGLALAGGHPRGEQADLRPLSRVEVRPPRCRR